MNCAPTPGCFRNGSERSNPGTMPEPMTSGLGDAAREALNMFVSQSLGFLVPGIGNRLPEWVASGTLFATPSGRGTFVQWK